jgi:hypothetical protein
MQQFMRKKGDHGMQSAGRALQVITCRLRAVLIAFVIGKPLIHVVIETFSRTLQGSAPEKGEQAHESCIRTQNKLAVRNFACNGMG